MATEIIPLDVNTLDVNDLEAWQPLASDAHLMPRLNGHHPAWLRAIGSGLSHKPFVIRHKDPQGRCDGILPLMYVKSMLFGRFLSSLPYINTGGVWCHAPAVANELIDHACLLADQLDVRYLELRHEGPFSHPQLNAERTDKVHMRLPLPDTDESFETLMKSKLRSQVKKSTQNGLTVEFGQSELLNDFYRVFAINMRDLGTPVFPKRLFAEILAAFQQDAELCIVRHGREPVAGGLLVHVAGLTEVPSASALRKFNHLNPNMLMYRNLLRRAIERRSHTFDFGRSSKESGTFKFKAQWGAEPSPAQWQYYLRKGSVDDMSASSPRRQKLIEIWKRLPMPIANTLGPFVVRGIP